MSAEYIDKNRLILCLNDWMLQNAPVEAGDDTTRADTILDAIRMVEDSPAADVRENVKAEWLNHEVFPAKGQVDMLQSAFCPNCKRYHTTPYSYYFTNYAYCPNCGAQMGGAEDGT